MTWEQEQRNKQVAIALAMLNREAKEMRQARIAEARQPNPFTQAARMLAQTGRQLVKDGIPCGQSERRI